MRLRRKRPAIISRPLTIKLVWPLRAAFTLLLAAVLIATCRPTVDTPGRDGLSGCQQRDCVVPAVWGVYRSVAMWATAIRFRLKTFSDVLWKWSHKMSYQIDDRLMKVAVRVGAVFLVCYFILCGDVSLNPGPSTHMHADQSRDSRPRHSEHLYPRVYDYDSQYDSYYQNPRASFDQFTSVLEQAISRMENSNRKQGLVIENRLKNVEEKILRRMDDLEAQQKGLCEELKDIRNQNLDIRGENDRLRKTVSMLVHKCDALDNQNRRGNLLFFGLPSQRGKFESVEDLELQVKNVIYKGMDIEADVFLDKVHRSGKVVIVTFISQKDKVLVLRNARKLKDSREYNKVFVREDFSESMQEKRRYLSDIQYNMRQRGEYAVLRRDRLVTRDAVLTVDRDTGSVVRTQRDWFQPRDAVWTDRSRVSQTGAGSGERSFPSDAASAWGGHVQPSRHTGHSDARYQRPSSGILESRDQPLTTGLVQAETSSVSGACGGEDSGGGPGQGHLSAADRVTRDAPPSLTYNLRSRRRDVTNNKGQTDRSPTDPNLRGFGRGRGRTPPPAQRTIDSMWGSARAFRSSDDSSDQQAPFAGGPRRGRERSMSEEREKERFVDREEECGSERSERDDRADEGGGERGEKENEKSK